ncbi:hypothetical protein [Henriciella aquimarina]|uniref:hypothetical protein n=1 Tax=Henriciella aquimarina TaxID=545261 RepID=UPI001F188243|nr:hypothetical protein [Henriciella aquimarina]
MLAAHEGDQAGRAAQQAVQQRYKAATAKALAAGFVYKPIDQLASETPIEEALARLLAVFKKAGPA